MTGTQPSPCKSIIHEFSFVRLSPKTLFFFHGGLRSANTHGCTMIVTDSCTLESDHKFCCVLFLENQKSHRQSIPPLAVRGQQRLYWASYDKNAAFPPERDVVDAHWEALRANGQGVRASQPLSPLELPLTGDWRWHHVSVLLLHLLALVPPRQGASSTFFPHAQAIQSDSRSIRLILTLEVGFFSSFILIKDTLKFQIMHLQFFLCSKVPKNTCRTYFHSCWICTG